MIWFLVLIVFANETVPEDQAANDPDAEQIRRQLSSVNDDLARLEQKLAGMRSDSRKLSDEIQRLELQRRLLAGKVEKAELELERANSELERVETRVVVLREKASLQKDALMARLRNLYKRGSLGYAQLFLKQARRVELINAYHYAKILTERDQRVLNDFRDTLLELDLVRENLALAKVASEEARVKLVAEKENLDALLAKRNQRLTEIRDETSRNQELLRDLELEKEELHMMIRRLTDTETDPFTLQVPVSRYRGKLNWPADARVIRRFGVYRDPEFGTKRRQNGVHLATEVGEPLKAMYSGRVLYADWFKSYGNLVIIDHNEKVLSFYAHCDRLLVKKGDFVERDQVVALAGDTGSLDGPRLHFEVRNKTVPENPSTWLRKRKR